MPIFWRWSNKSKSTSTYITDEGIEKAKELMKKYGKPSRVKQRIKNLMQIG